MASSRYTYMQKRVTTLRQFMLPARFSPTGLYSDRIHQRAAAFRLLVHAEFESYLEEAVCAHVANRMNDWVHRGVPSITLAALLAYDEAEGKPPSSLISPPQKPSGLLGDRLDAAMKRFNHKVRVFNHGVRELNVLSMVLPIGLEVSNLDTSWLADLDGWASERGDLAHQSLGKIQSKIDPAKEYTKVKNLVAGFRKLDCQIASIP